MLILSPIIFAHATSSMTMLATKFSGRFAVRGYSIGYDYLLVAALVLQ
jgi:hypothetical protein